MPQRISGEEALTWSRQLLLVNNVHELLWAALALLREHTRYEHGWLGMFSEDGATISFLSGIGLSSLARMRAADMIELPVAGDPMVEELLREMRPVVVVDAPTDPRPNQEHVALLSNRTIISLPLHIDGQRLGFLGVGTFGEEGPRPPTEQELDHLTMMASHLSVVLARLLAEQRREAAEAQLRASQRLEAMGRLAGGVAHDMNNLLTVMLGSVDLARLLPEDPSTVAGCLADIEAAATRAASLSRQLLSFSRRRVMQPRPVDLLATIKELAPLLQRVIPSTIRFDVVGEAPAVVIADAGQLEQVVMNLVLNARDALPEGGQLVVEAERVSLSPASAAKHPWSRPGDFVVLTVADTGEGMAAEVRERIFEPFFSTKGPEEGTGLGLAVVHGIVMQHGGLVHVSSEPGRGTTVRVYLPAAAERAASETAAPRPPVTGGGSERVLIAEDDDSVRRVIRGILSGAGYTVVEAADGAEALALVVKQQPDLLITDMVMPALDGAALIGALGAQGRSLPTLVISGYAAEGTRKLEVSDHLRVLSKPFRRAALLRAVRELLDRPAQ